MGSKNCHDAQLLAVERGNGWSGPKQWHTVPAPHPSNWSTFPLRNPSSGHTRPVDSRFQQLRPDFQTLSNHPQATSRSQAAASHSAHRVAGTVPHPGGNPGANLKSISHRRYLFEVACVWDLTQETIHLPLGCFSPRPAGS